MPFKHGHTWRKKDGRLGCTLTYSSWKSIRQRCLNKKCKAFDDYGGRGITICKRWLKFENFLKDMGERTDRNLSLDRINNHKGYYKNNCRWASIKEQSFNKRQRNFSSGPKTRGVYKLKSGNYAVRILNSHITTVSTKQEGAAIYNAIAKKLFKQNACTNKLAIKTKVRNKGIKKLLRSL